MGLIRKFATSLLLAFSVSLSAEEGWFPVNPPASALAPQVQEEKGVWVIFRKTVGQEQFLVRFPVQPEYRTVGERFETFAEKDGDLFELIALAPSPELTGKVQYVDGKWIFEEVVHTDQHTYLFRMVSERQNPSHFSYFFTSFSVEKIDENVFSS